MLCLAFCILSLVGGTLHYIFEWLPAFCNDNLFLQILFSIIIALGVFVGLNILFWIVILIWTLCLPKKEPKKASKSAYAMIYLAMDWLMSVSNIHVKIEGKELLPKQRFVLISNHLSDFDPMVWLSKPWKRRILFISKESNFRIPIVGRFIRRGGFLSIDRDDPMKAMRTLKKAADVMTSEDLNFGIYPEGTRSKDGKIHEFKEGAFLLAKKSNSPLVVTSIQNTEKIKKNVPFKSTKVIITVLRVYEPEMVASMKMSELAQETHDVILKKLGDDAKLTE